MWKSYTFGIVYGATPAGGGGGEYLCILFPKIDSYF